MDGLFGQGGRERRAALDEMGRGLEYYIPPQWRGLLSFLAEANPVRGMERAGVAAGEVVAPGATGLERVGAGGRLLSEMAGVAAPAAVAGRVGMPAAEAIQEGLLGVSAGARDVGRAVAERLNQPGPMPTLYSNPVPGLLAERRPGIIAYHGSPHTFEPVILIQMPDGTRVYQNLLERRNLPEGAQILEEYPLGRFDMSKIGTGEGAQAYGYGLYFAEAEDVAKGYRDDLSRGLKIDGGHYAWGKNAADAAESAILRAGLPPNIAERVSYYINRGYTTRQIIDHIANVDRASAEKLGNIISESDRPGRLYEVRIDADPEDFLDWDRPLSEQSEKVRRALGWTPEAEAAYRAAQSSDTDALLAALIGDADYIQPRLPVPAGSPPLSATGAEVMGGNSVFGSASSAAKANALREAGIPGIRYLDAGSRGAGDGTRNYVVFDDRLISIVRMYGIAGAAALLGMSVADVESALAAQPAQQPAPRGLFGEQ